MSREIAILVIVVSTMICVTATEPLNRPRQSQASYISSILPQALPVYQLLKASEALDVPLFKSVWYSETLKMWAAWGVKDYRSYVRQYRKHWRKELGRYRLQDLRFRYEGDEASGIVYVKGRSKEAEGLSVICENGAWKVRGGD